MLRFVPVFLLFCGSLYADVSQSVENTNFIVSQDNPYNYDRIRLRLDYSKETYFATFIGDGVNYYGKKYLNSVEYSYRKTLKSDTPFKTQTHTYQYTNGQSYAKIYRAYGGYDDGDNRIVIGLQNISMGVGRIWTPTNLFNPRNIYALEPDETFGVFALAYTKHLDDTSSMSIVISQKKDSTLKYAGYYKTYLDFADIGLDFVYSDDTKMIGYEIEGNLLDTGVELRSEGAYIRHKDKQNRENDFFQGIIGGDYAFVDGVTLSAEALYSSKTFSEEKILANLNSDILPNMASSHFYGAASLTYSINIFLDASLLYIDSFDDTDTYFISPSFTYTLNDYNSFLLGAMIEAHTQRYYLKWQLSF